MSAAAVESLFEATEARLHRWGDERNRATRSLGCPGSSTIAAMIDRVKVFEQQCKGVRVKALRRVDGTKDWSRDAKEAALELGHVEVEPTALGKESRSSPRNASMSFSSEMLRVEAIVQSLAGWMKKTVYRGYLYKQPDRIAARELQMDRSHYTSQRRAAVAYIAERLAGRECGTL